MTTLIMLVLLAGVLILIIVAVTFIGPGITRRLNVRLSLYIAGGYVALLLLLSVVCWAIPSAALKPEMRADEVAHFQGSGTFDTNLKAGIFDAPDGIARADRSFATVSDHITIVRPDNTPGQIYVGMKGAGIPDNGSRMIDVYIYTAGYMNYKGMNFAAPPTVPDVTLDESRLFVKLSAGRVVNLYEFNDQYTIPQFTGVDTTSSSWGSSAMLAIVVLVPPGVTVESSGCVTLPVSGSD